MNWEEDSQGKKDAVIETSDGKTKLAFRVFFLSYFKPGDPSHFKDENPQASTFFVNV